MWKGDDCSELNLLVLDEVKAAYPPPELINSTTSWGASVLLDSETSTYHMYVAEMANGCGMNTWSTNSQIAHATSSSPEGPFTRQSTVAEPFAHNPTAARAPDGTWVLFQIGCGGSQPCTQCAGGVTTGSCPGVAETVSCDPGPTPAKTPRTAHMLYATAPEGPWEAIDPELQNIGQPPSMGKFGVDNPAPYFFPNGSLLLLARCDYTSVGLVRADDWRGPYALGTEIGDASAIQGVEDPHLYRDSRGAFHALFHGGKQGGDWKASGAHAFSKDGIDWTYSLKPAFTTDITTASGVVSFNRRERPHLLLGKDGQPTHLVTTLTNWGLQGHGDNAFTHVHALNTKRNTVVQV